MSKPSEGPETPISGYESFSGSKEKSTHFLWWCAGVHQATLAQYPTEHPKYHTLGGVLLATFALAALSSGYAFFTIFNSTAWAIGFALLWGAIIFNLDRFMVSTIRKYGMSTASQWKVAFPRIILAVFIGITIARPLELKLFEKEVNLEVNRQIQDQISQYNLQQDTIHSAKVAAAMLERDQLQIRRKAMQDTLLKLQQAYLMEADGTGGSGKRGVETITRLKMSAFEQTAANYALLFPLLDSALAKQQRFLDKANQELKEEKDKFAQAAYANVGFLARNKALHSLSEREDSVFMANLLISLLIIILETAPILAKLLLPVGPYDIALAKEELVPMHQLEKSIAREQDGGPKLEAVG
ncbi:DUF4407 domain-containing protein [Flavihumibacter sp. CACIAM 22H1]|uniref:DUF4407 domain-containing protein n=1 Tax=Flavihumibacter sp. CACIAM 22H1 TaxID=1812911 RepID=UPI0007A85238|nr:DUF4407 domain-containing protein [Flavihumibacter sp. CACIAM 22H1]KYP15877.1 MAG: hypothetical protein A1D16_05955 [Flavihumibacter sp. CACIAM 22H1]